MRKCHDTGALRGNDRKRHERQGSKVIFRHKHDSGNPSARQASGAGSADSAERIGNLVSRLCSQMQLLWLVGIEKNPPSLR